MLFLKALKQHFPESVKILESCAFRESDMLLFLDDKEELIGCSQTMLERFGCDTFEALQARGKTFSQLFIAGEGCLQAGKRGWSEAISAQQEGRVKFKDNLEKLLVAALGE